MPASSCKSRTSALIRRLRITSARCSRSESPGLARHLVDLGHQRVQAPELRDPLRRGLGTDAGDTRQVVAALTDQCGDVGVLVGRHTVLVLHRLRVIRVSSDTPRTGGRAPSWCRRPAGRHRGRRCRSAPRSPGRQLRRERRDDVVGFVALLSRVGMRSASSTSLTKDTWPENSLGDFERFALYSVYSAAGRSAATRQGNAHGVGCSSRNR
jgi:hypothetical protein